MTQSPAMPAETESSPSPPPARFSQVVRLALRDAWDKLGVVLGVSLTWTLLLAFALGMERLVPRAAPVAAHLLVLFVALVLLLAAPLAGAYHIAHQIVTHDEVSYGEFWRGAARLYRPVVGLWAFDLFVMGVLSVNLWFYGRLGHVAGTVAMLLCLYLLLFWSLMALSHFPLLVAQEAGVFDEPGKFARRGTLAVLRRAFFLTLGRPFYALGILVLVVPLTVLTGLTGVLFALLLPGLLALLTTHSTRALLVQFGVLPPPPPPEEVVPDERFKLKDTGRVRQD
jgi:hypothetical protein